MTVVRLVLVLGTLLLLSPAHAEDAAPDSPKQPAAPKQPGSSQEALDEVVRELLPEVARIRGLPWKRPVEAQSLSKEKLRRHSIEMMEKDYPAEEQARDNRIVHRLGMLREDQQIGPLVRGMFEALVAGYYLPETKKLYLVEGPVGDALKPTLFHELIHALDDQHFDLRAIEEPIEDDADRQFAMRCVWEGCAVHAQNLFAQAYPVGAAAEIRQAFAAPGTNTADASALKDMPTWLIVDSLLHYRAGPYLVGQLAKDDFPGAMRKLFDDPPTTQEQFLHPHRWLDPKRRDHPRRVRWAGPWDRVARGWTVLHDTPVGELSLALLLNHFLDDEDGKLMPAELSTGRYVTDRAYEAAAGWDAGRTVVLEGPNDALVLVHAFAFDTPDDALEASGTLQLAMQARNAEVWKTPDQWTTRSPHPSTTTYIDGRGMGSILCSGRELLWLDGFPHPRTWNARTGPGSWGPLVDHLLRTRFVQDPRDKGDGPVPDPFADCALTLRRRGIGVTLPSDEWKVKRGAGATESQKPVAMISRRGAELHVMLLEQGLANGALTEWLDTQIEDLDKDALRAVTVAGWKGLHYPALRSPSRQFDIYAGSDGIRTVVVLAQGMTQIMRLYDDEIERIAAEIVSVPRY